MLLGCCQVRIDDVVGSPSIGVEGSVINGKSNENDGLLPTAGADGGGALLLSCPKKVSFSFFYFKFSLIFSIRNPLID